MCIELRNLVDINVTITTNYTQRSMEQLQYYEFFDFQVA